MYKLKVSSENIMLIPTMNHEPMAYLKEILFVLKNYHCRKWRPCTFFAYVKGEIENLILIIIAMTLLLHISVVSL